LFLNLFATDKDSTYYFTLGTPHIICDSNLLQGDYVRLFFIAPSRDILGFTREFTNYGLTMTGKQFHQESGKKLKIAFESAMVSRFMSVAHLAFSVADFYKFTKF